MQIPIRFAPLGSLLIVAAVCSGGCSSGTGQDTSSSTGQMTLSITDTPVDEAAEVVVVFTGVELKAAAEEPPQVFDFDEPRRIDLLIHADGSSEILLDDVELPAGDYEWIRLKVNADANVSVVNCDIATDTNSYIEMLDGSCHPLFIPSGSETGLKLVDGFTIAAGGEVDYTIDFDLRRSVIRPPGLAPHFLLKPALRLVDNLEVGSIEGEVAADIATSEDCTPVVYVYQGLDVIPDDLGSPTPPYVTSPVEMSDDTGQFLYRANFIPAGDYTAALTCQAVADDAEQDDVIEFLNPQNASVAAGDATIINF